MTDIQSVIRKNLSISKKAENSARIVKESQLHEAARYLQTLEMQDLKTVKSFFENSFGEAALCGDLLRIATLLFPEDDESENKTKTGLAVAILKSPVAQKALLQFFPDQSAVKISDFPDFRSACEAVTNNLCDYCILPMSSSLDGYYPTFSKLLKTYDLKICNIGRVSRQDTDEDLQFALLSRHIERKKGAKHIVFSFTEDEYHTPSRVICAIDNGGLKTAGVTGAPLEYDMDRCEYRIDALLMGNSVKSFLFFLNAALPGHTVLGIF